MEFSADFHVTVSGTQSSSKVREKLISKFSFRNGHIALSALSSQRSIEFRVSLGKIPLYRYIKTMTKTVIETFKKLARI